MIRNKEQRKSKRIPVNFADQATPRDEQAEENPAAEIGNSSVTAEEIGRQSSYEGETEVGQRVRRGPSDEQAPATDTAGAPSTQDLPEERERQKTPEVVPEQTREAHPAEEAAGPVMAELIATRAELRRLEEELAKAKIEHQSLRDLLLRRQAEFENFRKRMERERAETYQRVLGEIVNQLLPVIDNLRRALEAERSAAAQESEEFRHFLAGVELISKQLDGILENFGIKPVAAVGQPFDPHFHEAVATEPTDEVEPNTVVEELVRGYLLGDKLLRPAMVKVATRE